MVERGRLTADSARAADVARLDELARRLMSVSVGTGRRLDVYFERLGLTPAGARALLQLDPDTPLPTRNLAERLCCDPSNVTAFVDRLEESGLVERRVAPDGRRVKALAVTENGRVVRAEMAAIIATEATSLLSLSAHEQQTLLDLLTKAWAACETHDRTARGPFARP
jgi:DNA-binding MarR family transcriptional regulator